MKKKQKPESLLAYLDMLAEAAKQHELVELNDQLEKVRAYEEITQHLVINNTDDYNLRKASEELIELGLVLLQKVNKPLKVDDQEIIDEIGDVKIRLAVVKKMFDKDKIQERVDAKIAKYKEYIAEGTYTQI